MSTDDTELQNLISELSRNPDKIYDKNISEEDLLKIGKKISPYSYIKPCDDTCDNEMTIAAISHTNLTEDYLRRFLMVSMVGFIHRMKDEFEIDKDDRIWIDDSRQKEKLKDKEIYTPFTIDKIRGNVRQVNKYVKEYDLIEEKRTKLKHSITAKELMEETVPKADTDILLRYEKSLLSLTYICTHLLTTIGEDAVRRTPELVAKIREYDDVHQSIIELGYQPPPPPQEVIIPEDFL